MPTYKSKIGPELVIPISIIVIGTGIVVVYEKAWLASAIVLFVALFIVHIFSTTYYQVDNTSLQIRCSFLFNKTIDISTITEIRETNNPISSPATSLDRLAIHFNKFDTVIISPKDKTTFINCLTGINPRIKVTLKNSSKQGLTTF